ncbi:hypothetical protein ACFQQB_36310 [Nonomuraea rubra]|uniref:hypothetical protein n=1 Tax=Nonomuraea rubra TaxID=46180 RepID=UPI003616C96F
MTAGTYELCDHLADPTPALLERLRGLQLARNQVLLAAVQRRVPGHDAAFQELVRLQRDEPRLMAELLLLPQVGCWAVDALWRLDRGEEPDLAYLAAFAAGAAMRAGRRPLPFPGPLVPGMGTVTESGLVPIPSSTWRRARPGCPSVSTRSTPTSPATAGGAAPTRCGGSAS